MKLQRAPVVVEQAQIIPRSHLFLACLHPQRQIASNADLLALLLDYADSLDACSARIGAIQDWAMSLWAEPGE